MSKAVGVTLTATAISFGNEFLQGEVNAKIVVAGFASALFLDGVEHLNPTLGAGLAYIMLTTVLFTPFRGNSPLQTLGKIMNTTADVNSKLPTAVDVRRVPTP